MKDCLIRYKVFLLEHRSLSTNTLECYIGDIKQYQSYLKGLGMGMGKMHMADQAALEGYMDHMQGKGISSSTILRKLSSLRGYYRYLITEEEILEDPTENVERPKSIRKPPSILTIGETMKLLDQPQGTDAKSIRDKAMLELLYDTGIRVSELIALDIGHIHMGQEGAKCHISNKDRVMNISPRAFSYLKRYLDKGRNQLTGDGGKGSLFVNLNGKRMTRQGLWKIIKGYTKGAKIDKDITPHTLRHSFASHMLKQGADIHRVQKLLGHSDLSTTQIYKQIGKV